MSTVISERIWNGGHNGGNGKDNMKDLQEMGKGSYRGDLFINIHKSVTFLFDCCIFLIRCSTSQLKWENQFDDRMLGQCCFISLDGTGFHI